MYVLFLLVVLEDRLKHVLRVGDLIGAFVADVAHTGFDERRLELFIIAVLHIPEHERREAVFPFQAFQRVFVHAAGRDQHKSAGLARIPLHIEVYIIKKITEINKTTERDLCGNLYKHE